LDKNYIDNDEVYLIDFGFSVKCPKSGGKSLSNDGLKGSPKYLSILYTLTGKYRFIDDLISLFYSFLEIFSVNPIQIFSCGSLKDCINEKLKLTFNQLGELSSKTELILIGKYIDEFIHDFKLYSQNSSNLNPEINFSFLISEISEGKEVK
jgi:hypothetical protein